MTLTVALAAFVAASALGAEPSSTKAHRKASSEHAVHHTSAAAHHPATQHTSEKAAHRPTPEEIGRASGLKIRSQMARQASSGHRYTHEARLRRARYSPASRTAHLEAGAYHPTASQATASPVEDTERPAAGDVQPSISTRDGSEEALNEHSSSIPAARAPSDEPSGIGQETPQPTQSAPAGAAAGAAGMSESIEDPTQAQELTPESGSEVASLAIPHGAMPLPLRGSLESLERQNQRLADEGLERIENEDDLAARISNGLLVPLPVSEALTVNASLLPNHRYCRPWTARFLADLARDHNTLFHRPLEVSSAVRTVEYQRHLMYVNGNAAPAEGDVVSPHLTGATIDIAKAGLTRQEMAWMRQRLLALQTAGKIDVEEEFQQACFHITVYRAYAPPRIQRRSAPVRPKSQPTDDSAGPENPAQGL